MRTYKYHWWQQSAQTSHREGYVLINCLKHLTNSETVKRSYSQIVISFLTIFDMLQGFTMYMVKSSTGPIEMETPRHGK